jgi:hypothetical protein
VNDAGSGRRASYDAATVVRPPAELRADEVRTCRPGRFRGAVPFANVTFRGTRLVRASAATSKTEASKCVRAAGASFGITQVWVPVFTNWTGRP